MNDALKLLSKSLKPLGYHIRKYKAPNILKLPSIGKDNDSAASLQKAQTGQYWTKDANINTMTVYLRVCMRSNRNIDPKPRLGGNNIEEATLRCVNSLITAMNNAQNMGDLSLVVLDDRSDAPCLERLKKVLEKSAVPVSIETTKEQGQGQSLHEQFIRGKDQNAILYFVEDDYLHEADAIQALWNFYKQIAYDYETHSLLYPQEHQCLYDDLYPSYILASPDRHWRTISHATHTFVTHGHIVRDYWDYFKNTKFVGVKKKRKLGSEARTTNKLFKHIPGFSPLKPAAVHFQFEGLLPPFYNWEHLWESNKID